MSNAQKQSFIQSLSELQVAQSRQNNALLGKELPCHVTAVNGAIVSVQFDILPGDVTLPEITIPVFGFEYIRYPVQVGDKGVTQSVSVSLRGVSGLGVGMADMSRRPSLTALFFVPVGNIDWSLVDPDMLTMYGPKGVLVRTMSGAASVDIQDEIIVIKAPRIRLEGVIELAGPIAQVDTGTGTTATMIGPLDVQNDVTSGGISSQHHVHGGVQTGSGSTGKPK